MNWKLFVGIPLIAISLLSLKVYYSLYQLEHKFDHLPKVLAVPNDIDSRKPIPPYHGLQPSLLLRPSETHPELIQLGQVGPSTPLFAGPKQYPFLCNTEESDLGQPLVDNQQGIGIPIYQEKNNVINKNIILGYSKDCLLPTRAWYYYLSNKDNQFHRLENSDNDVVQLNINNKQIPFIVRVEIGTINRFIYTIATLKGAQETLNKPAGDNWNGKLIYQFRGGVGVGHKQGKSSPTDLIERRMEELKKGYAVIYSTGNQTSNHYNIWLSEDTALRVKQQFNLLYGQEDYVVGLGGSGGAVQQYLIAQNNPSFLDAAIALYSYPDMTTQITYAFDCELIEYYFDVTDNKNKKWASWENRRLIEGMNASKNVFNKYAKLYDFALRLRGYSPPSPSGMSECTKSWRGITPLVNNPTFNHHYKRFSENVFKNTHWSHWEDLKYFYGVDKTGYAQHTFDNVGVQYGLSALQSGDISIDEFIKLNAQIGGWKKPSEMTHEKLWKLNDQPLFSEFSIWSNQNMTDNSPDNNRVTARSEGNIDAMRAAYLSGNVFLGNLEIPVIDLRHYLEDELDMHHTSASFATRLRILRAQGDTSNQLIWIANKKHNPLADALATIDEWLMNLKTVKSDNVLTALKLSRPSNVNDRCYSDKGEIIAQGDKVWDGEWNNKTTGKCMSVFPIYSISRTVAGANLAGDTFKCALQSVDQAVDQGLYQGIKIEPYLAQLKQTFPSGVCDYSKPDQGKPTESLIAELKQNTQDNKLNLN